MHGLGNLIQQMNLPYLSAFKHNLFIDMFSTQPIHRHVFNKNSQFHNYGPMAIEVHFSGES